ncbi:DNA replication licensing factor MCM6, putative [Plasmodium knowlesi strain H]|uniref:DNA replication licensing factor MCM6 n=3 Tax=Plasmodium knowlesi TaxID=5850 RepID=A0A5K1UXA7_PLAKH|nr:DNA replication licensing factor MCM6, putative [Plasmodium knowlesi strain H]OTN64713.1 DNA helicase [Plasmodium knowlesi]CAA9988996.1 DNA replication licensing factor MCM6, putative [Plasmodium knowlesi strain H]SBO24840.1 DNA replication licensing factor MCM6, putative [Plasmodium knowlesi strain H]SBO27580.1 DNA replication licensing factor MCM6, putative [Plasmodium knowlesi strain H]VVS78470.1 DNA replication licensing factor MCM6, putative [Plasmodium knowlesi strain H]|eukprot:XP_002261344.1 replication licensing factor, putative [Plasmodium knowlesi strain H]
MSGMFNESELSGLDAHSVFGNSEMSSYQKKKRKFEENSNLGANDAVNEEEDEEAQEDVDDEEDEEEDDEPSYVQDENMAKVFEKFLKTFSERKNDEENEDGDDDSVWKDNLNLNFPSSLEIAQDAHYVLLLFSILQNSYSRNKVLVVDMKHVLMWEPTDKNRFDIGSQLYIYIKRHFLRILDIFEQKVQALAESINPIKTKEVGKICLRFYNKKNPIHSLRSLRCEMLGEMISVRGQVTRTSDVRPELTLAAFKCNECGNIINGVKQQFRYTQPSKCPSSSCSNMYDWSLVLEQSYFVDWQKIRLQEIAQESPPGSMPRNMDVILRNDIVDSVHAGDRIIVTGCLIVVPDIPTLMKPGDIPRSVARQILKKNENSLVSQGLTGIKGVGVQDLNHKLCIYACQIEKLNNSKKENSFDEQTQVDINCEEILNCDDLKWLRDIAMHPNTIDILAECIAPKIWGNIEIKKGALLMMTGGVQKITSNCKLRGDINMCIVGDPGTAKSEILKYVESFAPRAIFTSGKGSTAAGLTAAVHRDPDQGDTVLEAGALMYADQGICCIDEFDKMDEKDRVAIHEAMEQQTISITKAGIQATLNARASVLAACNPKYGRYDTLKTFAQNVNIPAPLLSRFDLFYTMLDSIDIDKDTSIANHLVSMHCGEEAEKHIKANAGKLDTVKMEVYLELSKRVKPLLTDEAKYKLIHYYVSFRNIEYSPGAQRSMRMTVRQLESLIRLSEAVAKLKFSHFVDVKHVEIACSIFKASMKKISNEKEINLDEEFDKVSNSLLNNRTNKIIQPEDNEKKSGEGKKGMTIKASEYQYISAIIFEIIKEYEFNNNSESITQDQLIETYLQVYAKAESNEHVDEWVYKLKKIIQRLINQDMKLLSETNEEDAENVILRIHPNYAGPIVEGTVSNKNTYGYNTFKNYQTEENIPGDDVDFQEDIDNF